MGCHNAHAHARARASAFAPNHIFAGPPNQTHEEATKQHAQGKEERKKRMSNEHEREALKKSPSTQLFPPS